MFATATRLTVKSKQKKIIKNGPKNSDKKQKLKKEGEDPASAGFSFEPSFHFFFNHLIFSLFFF